MGKGISLLCLVGGAALCADALGFFQPDYPLFEAPRWQVCTAGALLGLLGFMLMARDHRASDAFASILLLAVAVGAGWITFYAPPRTLERALPFIPAPVHQAMGRLLFAFGVVICVGAAVWAVRRLFR
ncbi:MAG: hypothetical protein WCE62_15990 [Polyangiales bacterium]